MLCPDIGEREVGGGSGQVLVRQEADVGTDGDRDAAKLDASVTALRCHRKERFRIDVPVLWAAWKTAAGSALDAYAFDGTSVQSSLSLVVRAAGVDRFAKGRDRVERVNEEMPGKLIRERTTGAPMEITMHSMEMPVEDQLERV
jgi:hypothetical protein